MFFTNTFPPNSQSSVDWLFRYGNCRYRRQTIHGKRENRIPSCKVRLSGAIARPPRAGLHGLEGWKAPEQLTLLTLLQTVPAIQTLSCHHGSSRLSCLCWSVHQCRLLGQPTATCQGQWGHIKYRRATCGATWSSCLQQGPDKCSEVLDMHFQLCSRSLTGTWPHLSMLSVVALQQQ